MTPKPLLPPIGENATAINTDRSTDGVGDGSSGKNNTRSQ